MEANTKAPLLEGVQRILIDACMQIKGAVQATLHCGEKKNLILTPTKTHKLHFHASLYREENSNEVELCDILNLALSQRR